jgi:hypothetical protein
MIKGNYSKEIKRHLELYNKLLNEQKKDLFVISNAIFVAPSERYLISLPIKKRKSDEDGILIDKKDANEIIALNVGYSLRDKNELVNRQRIYPFRSQISCEFPLNSEKLERILKGESVELFRPENSGPMFYPRGD